MASKKYKKYPRGKMALRDEPSIEFRGGAIEHKNGGIYFFNKKGKTAFIPYANLAYIEYDDDKPETPQVSKEPAHENEDGLAE